MNRRAFVAALPAFAVAPALAQEEGPTPVPMGTVPEGLADLWETAGGTPDGMWIPMGLASAWLSFGAGRIDEVVRVLPDGTVKHWLVSDDGTDNGFLLAFLPDDQIA